MKDKVSALDSYQTNSYTKVQSDLRYVHSDRPSISANSIEIGPNNDSTFYFTDSATVWTDIDTPIINAKVAGSHPPLFQQWGTGGIYINKFDVNDEVFLSIQMPHSWKIGTQIYPHIHWCQDESTGTPAAGLSAVRWNLEITWAGEPGGSFKPSSTATYWTTADVIGESVQTITNISPTGINPIEFDADKLSSVLIARLYRGGTGDTYGNPVVAVSFDIHYEIDSIGSEVPFYK